MEKLTLKKLGIAFQYALWTALVAKGRLYGELRFGILVFGAIIIYSLLGMSLFHLLTLEKEKHERVKFIALLLVLVASSLALSLL